MGKGQDRVSLSPEAAQRERQEEAESCAVPGPYAATSVVGRVASSETHSPLCRWGNLVDRSTTCSRIAPSSHRFNCRGQGSGVADVTIGSSALTRWLEEYKEL